MLGGHKNLKGTNFKDSISSASVLLSDRYPTVSYTKTNKLITALYMVTDIMDSNEPIRLKLRTLGVSILSDINSLPRVTVVKNIQEVLSFLNIASTIGLVSSMNASILEKEFIELHKSLHQNINNESVLEGKVNLAEFFKEEPRIEQRFSLLKTAGKPSIPKGHLQRTRLGVQKGHSLMQALSDRLPEISHNKEKFDVLKKERREEIIKSIKNNPNGATITDIKNNAQGVLMSFGEKTLQRELISMVKDNVLNKVGEKRWSRYFLPNNQA